MASANAAWQAQLVAVALGADPEAVRSPSDARAEFDRQLASEPQQLDRSTLATLRVMGVA